MKSLVVLGLLLIVSLVAAQSFVPGKRIKSRAVKPVAEICAAPGGKVKRFCNGSPDPICDASGFVFCNGAGKGIEFECGGDLPYCVVGSNGDAKCSNVRSETCGPAVADFDCFEEGIFPDPLNCKKYYVCSDDGAGGFTADEYSCDNYYVFDPSAPGNEFCRLTMNRYCVTADCKGQTKNILLNYPFLARGRGQFVASCRGTKKPLVFRCAPGFTAKLNTLPVECELQCSGVGKFEYSGDSTKYYECVYNGRGYEPKVKSCFRNYFFDKNQKICVVNPTPASPTSTVQTSTVASTASGSSSVVVSSTVSGSSTVSESSTVSQSSTVESSSMA